MFKVAICDDESCFRQTIQDLICNYLSKNGILCQIDTFCSGEEFLSSGIAMIFNVKGTGADWFPNFYMQKQTQISDCYYSDSGI